MQEALGSIPSTKTNKKPTPITKGDCDDGDEPQRKSTQLRWLGGRDNGRRRY
jgi:hypothetical protein